MATRRSRIKGIANIPQRRKADTKPETIAEPTTNDVTTEPVVVVVEAPKLALEEPTTVTVTADDATKPKVEVLHRRTFIKPIVNPKLLAQRPKFRVGNVHQEDAKQELPPPTLNVSLLDDDNIESQPNKKENLVQQNLAYPVSMSRAPNFQCEQTKSGSDTEYSAAPLSPTKLLNRSRIKAVPRLGHRRTSVTLHGSASESEDDVRKNIKRIRTESACSTVSVTNDSQMQIEPGSPLKKEFSSVIQRKCKRTEQSRKMAEARRHFLHKFGNQAPDKQKLTMIDLIFYNPTTNPMSQKPKKQPGEDIKDEENVTHDTNKAEEQEIEPPEEPPHIESDEENAIPAPQIKIGANGEIVVDEKSLVIENIETKRGREELQKSKVVDGDFDTGYGVYKREKRSKDWSKEETLRFYKALHTLGTDFTLMVELFSGRSRRELKLKFKKEERVNRSLVDKALMQPVPFDITELRREAIEDQKRAQELQAEKRIPKLKSIKNQIPYYARRVQARLSESKYQKKIEEKPQDIYSKIEKGIACVWEASDTEDESANPSDAILKPTRSGRIPKPSKPFDYDVDVMQKMKSDTIVPQSADCNLEPMALQPGSLMIVTSQTPTGEPAFKVFMVAPGQNRIPITLTADVLSNLTEQSNFENNVTIPADTTILAQEAGNAETKDSILTEYIDREVWQFEQANVSVPVVDNQVLPDDTNNVLCCDGKYDVRLAIAATENE